MKKVILSCLFTLCLSSVPANELADRDNASQIASCRPYPLPIFEESLKEILVPDWIILNRQNLYQGPIAARHVTSNCDGYTVGKGWVHVGHYVGGGISTLVEGKSDYHHTIGEQIASLGSEISQSKRYSIETICGETYVIHYHSGFKVYSTSSKQFVVAD